MLLAESLKTEYVTRNAGNAADMFAFWTTDESPILTFALVAESYNGAV